MRKRRETNQQIKERFETEKKEKEQRELVKYAKQHMWHLNNFKNKLAQSLAKDKRNSSSPPSPDKSLGGFIPTAEQLHLLDYCCSSYPDNALVQQLYTWYSLHGSMKQSQLDYLTKLSINGK